MGTTKTAIALALISVVVSGLGVLGYGYVSGEGSWALSPMGAIAGLVLSGALFALCAFGLSAAYKRLADADRQGGAPKSTSHTLRQRFRCLVARIAPAWNLRHIALLTVVMLLLWLPWAVALFPGGVGFDTYYQIYQCYPESHPITAILTRFFDDAPIAEYFTDHHPIFDTLLFGAFGMASDGLTGNWNLGIAVYVAIQAVATAATLTAATAFLRKGGCAAPVALALYLFFCLMPLVPTSAFTMGKDSLFSLLYVPYFMLLVNMAATRGECLARTRTAVCFIAVGVLLCLTKKTGMYVVVPTALVALLLFRKQWRPLVAQAAACLLTMLVILPCVVFPLLSVAPGGKQEALGVLLQQTAAYAQRHPASSEERNAIDAVADYKNLREVYTYGYHDYVKWLYNQQATTQEVAGYLGAWASMGARDPEAYLSALMGVAGQYVAPVAPLNIDLGGRDRFFNDANRYFADAEDTGRLMVSYPESLRGYREALASCYAAAEDSPILRWPLETVLYVLWMPALAAFVMVRLRLRAGILLVPTAIGLLFCLIGPVFDARYCLPLVCTAPLLLGALCCLARGKGQASTDAS